MTLTFFLSIIHYSSVMNISQEDGGGQLGKDQSQWIKQEVQQERWGICWTSGCSPWLSANLLFDLEQIRKLGDPQPVGSTSHCKKKKNSISQLHELFRYWPTASKIYRRVVCLSHTLFPILLSIFLSFSPLTFYLPLLFFLSPPSHSDLSFCASERIL